LDADQVVGTRKSNRICWMAHAGCTRLAPARSTGRSHLCASAVQPPVKRYAHGSLDSAPLGSLQPVCHAVDIQ
jgi:hypothetical protein